MQQKIKYPPLCGFTRQITPIFLSSLAILYSIYLFLDLRYANSIRAADLCKYAGILLCILYTALLAGPRRKWLVPAGLFVLFADYCLLFSTNFFAGITAFCLVQCFYRLHLAGAGLPVTEQLVLLPAFLGRALIPAALFTLAAFCFFQAADGLLFLCFLYAGLLFQNMVAALCASHRTPGAASCLFALGLILYALCDLNVGLANLPALYLSAGIGSPPWSLFQRITFFSMWLFYLPAQACIALSSVKSIKDKNARHSIRL